MLALHGNICNSGAKIQKITICMLQLWQESVTVSKVNFQQLRQMQLVVKIKKAFSREQNYLKLGQFTMVSQPIRLILVDWLVFHFCKGRFPFKKKIKKKNQVVFIFQFFLGRLPFFFFLGHLPFFFEVVIQVFSKKNLGRLNFNFF